MNFNNIYRESIFYEADTPTTPTAAPSPINELSVRLHVDATTTVKDITLTTEFAMIRLHFY